MIMMQIVMLTLALLEVIEEAQHLDGTVGSIPYRFEVLLVKVPCAVAMHLGMIKEIQQGLEIMKFA